MANVEVWLVAHDPDFRTAKKDWEDFVLSFTDKIEEVDGTIPPLPAKDLVSSTLLQGQGTVPQY